jgi:hypothetical protein
MTIESDGILLHGKAGLENRGPMKAKNNPLNILPTSICFRLEQIEQAASNLAESVNTIHKITPICLSLKKNFSDSIRDSVISTSKLSNSC